MTWTGALRRAFAAAKPPNPPPTITTRGVLPELELLFAIFGFGFHSFSSFRAPRFHKFLRFVRRLTRSGGIANMRRCYERNCCLASSPADSQHQDLHRTTHK